MSAFQSPDESWKSPFRRIPTLMPNAVAHRTNSDLTLSSWQAKFGAQGLSVIGITDDPVAEASQGAQSFGMKYAAIATDPSYSTQRAFGVRALPTVFLIDKRGVIRDVSVGFDPRKEAQMEALMMRLLAEPAP